MVLGHTMQHATAGLCEPASYRVAGDAYGAAGTPRMQLRFELRPRPSADLAHVQEQLAAAGHHVALK